MTAPICQPSRDLWHDCADMPTFTWPMTWLRRYANLHVTYDMAAPICQPPHDPGHCCAAMPASTWSIKRGISPTLSHTLKRGLLIKSWFWSIRCVKRQQEYLVLCLHVIAETAIISSVYFVKRCLFLLWKQLFIIVKSRREITHALSVNQGRIPKSSCSDWTSVDKPSAADESNPVTFDQPTLTDEATTRNASASTLASVSDARSPPWRRHSCRASYADRNDPLFDRPSRRQLPLGVSVHLLSGQPGMQQLYFLRPIALTDFIRWVCRPRLFINALGLGYSSTH